jgi:hypothetical protein
MNGVEDFDFLVADSIVEIIEALMKLAPKLNPPSDCHGLPRDGA